MKWPFVSRAVHDEVVESRDAQMAAQIDITGRILDDFARLCHERDELRSTLMRERDDAQQKYDTLVHETLAMVKDGFHAPRPEPAPLVAPTPKFSDRVLFAIDERAAGDIGWSRQLKTYAIGQMAAGADEDTLVADIRSGGIEDEGN